MSEIWSKMYIGLRVKYRCYSCGMLMELEFSGQIFDSDIKVNLLTPEFYV